MTGDDFNNLPNAIYSDHQRVTPMSNAEETLALQFQALKIDVVREYRFHDTRRWRWRH